MYPCDYPCDYTNQALFRFHVETPNFWLEGHPFLAHFEGEEHGQVSFHPVILVEMIEDDSGMLITVAPVRPVLLINPRVTWIEETEKLLPEAMKERLIDYMASVESTDVKVSIEINPAFAPVINQWFLTEYRPSITHNADLKTDHVIITDRDNGIQWGPLPLHPEGPSVEWPYPGVVRDSNPQISLKPLGRGLKVTDGVFSLNLETHEAIPFAVQAARYGWRQAFSANYPGREANLNYSRPPQ